MEKKTIVIIGAIAIILAGLLGFLYYRERIFSKEILKLEILGQETAKMGDEISYMVKYKNNGNFVLQNPKLVFQLPDNSLTEDGQLRLAKELEDIYPGGQGFAEFKVRLLGKEGDLKVTNAWLSYVPKNLSARYESHTTFTTKIESVPITLTYDLPSKVEKGKEVSYVINYFSNINYPLENLSIKVDTINGFNVESATPVSLDNAEWKLVTLQKAQGGRITIKGSVTGETGTALNFSAHLGMWRDGTFVVIKEASQDVQVINPLLFISQQVNGSLNYIASPGQMLRYQIFLRNIGSSPIDNLFVTSRIDGSAFDLSTLASAQGQVRSNDGLVVWDAKQVLNLQKLNPGQETRVAFDVKLKDSWVPSDSERNNTLLKNIVSVSNITQEFAIKVNSNLIISQEASYAPQGGFENSGPIPPKVGTPTTYVIAWQIKNYLNEVRNVKVRAVLLEGITLTAVLPEDQISHFSLDSVSHEIVWSVGNLSAGAGVANTSPSIYFQVTLTPTFSMRQSAASLIGKVTITGEDQSTGITVTSNDSAIDTSLPDDPSNSGGGIVQ